MFKRTYDLSCPTDKTVNSFQLKLRNKVRMTSVKSLYKYTNIL